MPTSFFPAPLPAAFSVPAAFPPAKFVDHPMVAIRGKLRLSAALVALLVLGFGTAAATVPIGAAVVASGSVDVASSVRRIAHPIGGTIAAIFVRDGDRVAKGAPLLRLDDAVSGSDAALSSLSVDQLVAQRARLAAEQIGAGNIIFPVELAGRHDPAALAAMADQRSVFASRHGEQLSLQAQLTAQIAQLQQQIAGYRAQIAAAQQQQQLIEPERQGLENLYKRGLVTLNRRNELERQSVDYKGSVASLQTSIAQAEARIAEARSQMIERSQTARADAGTQLGAVDAALNQQRQRQVVAGDLQSRTLLRAPVAGVVDKLAFTTIGDVIKPAETVMEVVPDRDAKIVEAMVSPADIDQVRNGEAARVRFSAFNAALTPEVTGRVTEVAANRTVDPATKQEYYVVRVALDRGSVARMGGTSLVAGMPAEVFITGGTRSLLSYIVKPLRDQITRAFRDS